jgi:hypothetical protein
MSDVDRVNEITPIYVEDTIQYDDYKELRCRQDLHVYVYNNNEYFGFTTNKLHCYACRNSDYFYINPDKVVIINGLYAMLDYGYVVCV